MSVAIVTGGTRGIGKAIVHRFLQKGFFVFTTGKNPASVSALIDWAQQHGFGAKLDCQLVDMSVKEQILNWVKSLNIPDQQALVLVNNAGIYLPGSIASEDEGVFEALIQTNLASAYHTTRAFLPQIRNALKGHIFNICSTASITAYTNGGSYCISKFGLLGFSKVLREELKSSNVGVTALLPGATLTDSWAGVDLPESRFMQTEDVASVLWNAWELSPGCVLEEVILRPVLGDIG
jgi:short-subunit dehydrogenase